MATSTTRADQRLRYYSASAHRVRATVEYLRQATSDFISPDVWPPNSPDLSGRLQNLGLSSRPKKCLSEAHMRHQRAETAPG